MITITLTDIQASTVRDALHRYLSDLSMEISDTDSKDYRDMLKERREHLRALVDQLPAAAA